MSKALRRVASTQSRVGNIAASLKPSGFHHDDNSALFAEDTSCCGESPMEISAV